MKKPAATREESCGNQRRNLRQREKKPAATREETCGNQRRNLRQRAKKPTATREETYGNERRNLRQRAKKPAATREETCVNEWRRLRQRVLRLLVSVFVAASLASLSHRITVMKMPGMLRLLDVTAAMVCCYSCCCLLLPLSCFCCTLCCCCSWFPLQFFVLFVATLGWLPWFLSGLGLVYISVCSVAAHLLRPFHSSSLFLKPLQSYQHVAAVAAVAAGGRP